MCLMKINYGVFQVYGLYLQGSVGNICIDVLHDDIWEVCRSTRR